MLTYLVIAAIGYYVAARSLGYDLFGEQPALFEIVNDVRQFNAAGEAEVMAVLANRSLAPMAPTEAPFGVPPGSALFRLVAFSTGGVAADKAVRDARGKALDVYLSAALLIPESTSASRDILVIAGSPAARPFLASSSTPTDMALLPHS